MTRLAAVETVGTRDALAFDHLKVLGRGFATMALFGGAFLMFAYVSQEHLRSRGSRSELLATTAHTILPEDAGREARPRSAGLRR